MSEQDYFHDRAELQLSLAEAAEHPKVARAHYVLASYYLDRCYGGGASDGLGRQAFFTRPDNAE